MKNFIKFIFANTWQIIIILFIFLIPNISFSEDTLFSGIIYRVIPPSLLTPPYCPFTSIIVIGPHSGWFALTPYPPKIYSVKYPFSQSISSFGVGSVFKYVIGNASKIPCGIVPGIIKNIASTP